MAFINIIPPINKIKDKYDLIRLIKNDKIDITIRYDQISYDEYYTNINKNYIIIKKLASSHDKLYLEIKLNDVTRECNYPIDYISNTKDYIEHVLYTFIDIFTPELNKLLKLKFDFNNENLMNEISDIHAKFYDKYNQIQGENIL